jgi:hypothetical protein
MLCQCCGEVAGENYSGTHWLREWGDGHAAAWLCGSCERDINMKSSCPMLESKSEVKERRLRDFTRDQEQRRLDAERDAKHVPMKKDDLNQDLETSCQRCGMKDSYPLCVVCKDWTEIYGTSKQLDTSQTGILPPNARI